MAFSMDGISTTDFISDSLGQCAHVPTREKAKSLARMKQETIGNELSRVAHDEYLEDVMAHMAELEIDTLPDASLIDQQRELQWFMRPFLMDFLIEAHTAFGLLPETLHLTVNLLDRYCSKRVVYKQHYQLVGCASLLIAAKYGDVKDRVPLVHELNSMCCGLYEPGMFPQMEMHVLNTLDWNIGHPTVDFFIQLIVTESAEGDGVQHMAGLLAEISLYSREFVSTKPSVLASASVRLARIILRQVGGVGLSFDGDGDGDVHGSWAEEEQKTMVGLMEQLRTATTTLDRKYASPQLSQASAELRTYLAAEDARQREANPPSPPAECDRGFKTLNTPHKPVPGLDGLHTPPITPDMPDYADALGQYSAKPCPSTPTPETNSSSVTIFPLRNVAVQACPFVRHEYRNGQEPMVSH